MTLIECSRSYAESMRVILNEAIQNSTALYDYTERTSQSMSAWFDSKEKGSFPVIGIVDENNRLLAFGSYGNFRERQAYQYTVEHSVYVDRSYRGKGLGKRILNELIDRAKQQNYHCMIAAIDSANAASIHIHKSRGFTECGHIREVGYKFGGWLDLVLFQLLLHSAAPSGKVTD